MGKGKGRCPGWARCGGILSPRWGDTPWITWMLGWLGGQKKICLKAVRTKVVFVRAHARRQIRRPDPGPHRAGRRPHPDSQWLPDRSCSGPFRRGTPRQYHRPPQALVTLQGIDEGERGG